MAEKVIHEMRVVETDDGYRIEVKGDKERMKALGLGRGWFGRMHRHRRRRWGRHHHPHGWGHRNGPDPDTIRKM